VGCTGLTLLLANQNFGEPDFRASSTISIASRHQRLPAPPEQRQCAGSTTCAMIAPVGPQGRSPQALTGPTKYLQPQITPSGTQSRAYRHIANAGRVRAEPLVAITVMRSQIAEERAQRIFRVPGPFTTTGRSAAAAGTRVFTQPRPLPDLETAPTSSSTSTRSATMTSTHRSKFGLSVTCPPGAMIPFVLVSKWEVGTPIRLLFVRERGTHRTKSNNSDFPHAEHRDVPEIDKAGSPPIEPEIASLVTSMMVPRLK